MTRLEKCKILKDRGYTYNPETGEIFGVWGTKITSKHNKGYIAIQGNSNYKGSVYGHHFAWYMTYGNVDFDELDHIDNNPLNNKISNLRIADRQLQNRNRGKSKGYIFDSSRNKWLARIFINRKAIYLGRYDTEEEARQAYLQGKEKYWDVY